MICAGCASAQHDQCYDVLHHTDYRSCTCLHRVKQEAPSEQVHPHRITPAPPR